MTVGRQLQQGGVWRRRIDAAARFGVNPHRFGQTWRDVIQVFILNANGSI